MRSQGAWHPDSLSYIIAKRLGFKDDTPNEPVVRSALIRRILHRRSCDLNRRRRIPIWVAISIALVGIAGVALAPEPAPYLLIIVFVPAGLFLYHRQFRRWEAQLRSLPNVCVVCIYDLSGINPECDGCTICPECGGAWKLGDPD